MEKKKSLGQHFLHSKSYLNAVADAAHIKKGETVLEIGPGEGALTEVLLERGAHVLAIEKDHRLIAVLQEKFAKEVAEKKLVVIEGDALARTDSDLFPKSPWVAPRLLSTKSKSSRQYKIVGNIPYYITGALIRKYLTEKHQQTTLVFLVQKEVAQRIISRSEASEVKESVLSLSVKAYGTPVYVKTVPRGAFVPAPGVDSAILLVKDISRKNFKNVAHEKKFFILVKAGFAQKRKLLKRNIETVLGKQTLAMMQNAGIPENARAEDVALKQWLVLSAVEGLVLSKTRVDLAHE